jgi:hypothetical protein
MVCDLAFFQPGRSAASGRGRDSTNVGGIPATHAGREQQGWTRNRRSRSEPRRSPSLKAPPGQPDPSPATVLATVAGWIADPPSRRESFALEIFQRGDGACQLVGEMGLVPAKLLREVVL